MGNTKFVLFIKAIIAKKWLLQILSNPFFTENMPEIYRFQWEQNSIIAEINFYTKSIFTFLTC